MIDVAAVEEYMRATNPIPSIDSIDVDELASSAQAVHAKRAMVMRAPTEERTQRLTASPPQRSKRAWAFAVSLIVVIVSIGVVTLLLTGGEREVADEPAPTIPSTEAPDLTEGEASPVPLVGSEWTTVSVDDGVFGPGAVTNVIAIPDGFLAVGERCGGETSCRAAIWRSPDGVEWALVFVDPVGDPGASPNITRYYDAAMSDLGYLAVGSTDNPYFETPVFAFSADGVTWERFVPTPGYHEPTDDPEGIYLHTRARLSVVAAHDGFLVAGQSCMPPPQEYDCRGVIWRSEDGRDWTKVLEDVPDSAFESIARVHDRYLAVGGAGVGVYLQSQGDEVVRVWSSFDGITWTDVSTDPFVFGSQRPDPDAREYAQAVAAIDSGFIVAGTQLDVLAGAIWFSEDGEAWKLLPQHEVLANATITGIAASGDQLIAVGALRTEPSLTPQSRWEDGPSAAAWRSDDGGFTWERMGIDPALTSHDLRFAQVAIRGDTALAGLSVGDHAAIWAVDLLGTGDEE